MQTERKIDSTVQMLRYALGGTALVAGVDKFFDLLTEWEQYLSPMAKRRLPVSNRNFMRLVGVIEMGAGAMILSGRTRAGGYIAGVWLLGIAANLVANGDYDIAVRDVNMAVGAFAMAKRAAARRSGRELEQRPSEGSRAA